MKKIIYIATITLIVLSNMMCTSTRKIKTFGERIDSLMNEYYTDDAPGFAMAICRQDSIIYENAIGLSDVVTKEQITKNTVFNIASITKQFTVSSILKLHEKGLLDINDSVSKYFPEFKSKIWEKVKLKHLMSHSSGIPDRRPRIDKDFMLHIVDEQCLEYMIDLDELVFEPGTQYDYKNPTFQILSGIIQRVSGMPFERFQDENIFKSASMTNVRYFEPDEFIPNMAHGYINISDSEKSDIDSDSQKDKSDLKTDYIDGKGARWMEFDYGEETFFGTKADGGIYTSLNDFIKWEIALLNNSVISQNMKELAYSPQIQVSGSRYSMYQNRPYTCYGYGWFIDQSPNRETKIYHTGDNGGFQAYAAKYPESGICVIMFENRNDLDRWTMQTKIENILIEEGIVLRK